MSSGTGQGSSVSVSRLARRLLWAGWLGLAPALFAQPAPFTFSTISGVAAKTGSADGNGGGSTLPLFNHPFGVVLNTAGNLYVTDASNGLVRVVTPGGVVTTFAGNPGLIGDVDGTGTDPAVSFNSPQGLAFDSSGNLFVADYNGNVIRKITPAGVITTIAGTTPISGTTDATGALARFSRPAGVATDSAGNVYVTDSANSTIRLITPAGVVTTFAGTAGSPGGADGTGSAARFNNPRGLTSDSAGNLYVADTGNNCIRKVTSSGIVTTLAGLAGTFGSTDGTGSAARFTMPFKIAVDAADNLYVADTSQHTIRRITPAGVVSTFAGSPGLSGSADGTGSAARFNSPNGLAVDSAGNVFVADGLNCTIRKITPTGAVTTFAGDPGVLGSADGTGSAAQFGYLTGDLAIDHNDNLYVPDRVNHIVRKVTPAGEVTTLAGTAGRFGAVNGTGPDAQFYEPTGIAVDGNGNVFVADSVDYTVRRISPAGVVTSLAGLSRDDSTGAADGTAAARFNSLASTAVGPNGDIYVADTLNATIRKISATGAVTTLAGQAGNPGSADGTGSAARFDLPYGVAVNGAGTVFVTDAARGTIRQITPAGVVTTLAGDANAAPGYADGTGSAAHFANPNGIAVDSAGNLYVADADNLVIRKVTPGGVVTTLAGTAGAPGGADGTGANARFQRPTGIAVDATGNLYVADSRGQTIRKISPAGAVTTLAGQDGIGGSDDGTGNAARFLEPSGITVDPSGTVFVAEGINNLIRRISPAGAVSTLGGLTQAQGSADGVGIAARFARPPGIAVDAAGQLFIASGTTVRQGRLAGPPVITGQPQGATVTAGASLQLTVTAAASPDPVYQWQLNGNPIAGATGRTLSLASVRGSDAGDYTVVITNSLGTVTSSKATLTVTAVVAPPTTPPASGGGGGAPSAWFFLSLVVLGATRRWRGPRHRPPAGDV